jgi:adenylate cyclase
MANPVEALLGKKVGGTRVTPLVWKIVLVFSIFVLAASLTTNYINLMFNRTELIKSVKELLVKDLKDIYTFSSSQRDIFEFTGDQKKSMANIEESALRELKNSKAVALGIRPDGTVAFMAAQAERMTAFPDAAALAQMTKEKEAGVEDGSLNFTLAGEKYFGVYKYNARWDVFILRAEELKEMYSRSQQIFINVSGIILIITALTALVGIVCISYILRFVGYITNAIMKMQKSSQMGIVDLSKAPNDEITFLGVAFNSLSSSINNLVSIFRKFVSKDLVNKAYKENEIRLEGSRMELTILFSDIRSFTNMTETLGTDIIKLLNLHYERAIGAIVKHDGIIGSLIGDAVLAVFGTFPETRAQKSMLAIKAAYSIQDNAAELRLGMAARREQIAKERGGLSAAEEKIYKAVLLEVGVGIDGGNVFYGNIGSDERMTNTVIGDNVNSASRLEGLTRIYNVPVIVSAFVRDDIEENVSNHGIRFVEIDQVQVKGKTEGKRVFWAIPDELWTSALRKDIDVFSEGLKLYYAGDWKKAYKQFALCSLPLAVVFKERTKDNACPKEWNGIWAMQTK